MSSVKTVEILLKNCIETNLCSHCGACVGVCPVGAICNISNSIIVNSDKCIDCGLCTAVCPAEGYMLSDLTIGDIQDIPRFSACSKEKNVTDKASSGGFVTQTLLSLLESGDITAAAVVVTGDDLTGSSAKYIVTSDREDILSARRSKYTQASIADVLNHIKHNDGKYAIVGLPCQLYAISKAMERIPSLRNRIVYKIGMVCGYTYEESCIDGLLKVLGTTRDTTESVVGWRENGLPGSFAVRLKNGDILSMPFADEHSVDVTYYAQNRCLLCKDCLCEYGDVVCADIGGWSNRKTLVMARTLLGHQLLDKLCICGSLDIEPCDIPFEKTVLPFMLREKRSKVDIRTGKYEKCGRPTPGFVGGHSPKLLLSQKIEAVRSLQLQEYARKNRDVHSRSKMLKLGHKSYHKLSEKFSLKVLFKLQMYMNAFCKKAKILLRKILEKFSLIFSFVSLNKVDRPMNVAVVGLGRWGSQYLSLLKKSSRFKVVAAYDNDRQRLENYSKQYGFCAAASLKNLCQNFDVDAIFVLTPTPTHYDIFTKLSQYHIPVYLEKPIAGTPAETSEMISIANQEDVLLYVAHSMKYEPAIQKIKKLLDAGTLGNITDIRIARTVRSRNDIHYPDAALYQIGVHLIDVLLYLTDNDTACENLSRYTCENIDNISFTKGKIAVKLQYGFGCLYNFSLQITCDSGHIFLADGMLTTVINSKKSIYRIPMKNEKTICSELDEFYRAIRKGEPYLNTKESAQRIVALCEQIAKTGECI